MNPELIRQLRLKLGLDGKTSYTPASIMPDAGIVSDFGVPKLDIPTADAPTTTKDGIVYDSEGRKIAHVTPPQANTIIPQSGGTTQDNSYQSNPVLPSDSVGYTGNSKYSHDDVSNLASNLSSLLNGGNVYDVPSGATSLERFQKLQAAKANARANNEGLYKIDPNAGFSPDQIRQVHKAADDFYDTQIEAAGQAAQKEISNTSNTIDTSSILKSTDNTSHDWVQGLLTSPRIGASSADTKRILAQLPGMSPEDQIATVKQIVYASLPTSQKELFDNNDSASAQTVAALTTLPEDMKTNPYKYTAQQYITFLGGEKDPKYAKFQADVASIIAPIRKSYYGASLTDSEQAAANQFLPDLSRDDIKTIIIKLNNVNRIANYVNDAIIARNLGMKKPDITSYVNVQTPGEQKSVSTGSGNDQYSHW